MLYKEWVDFVSFPLDPYKVNSREQRLDTSQAINPYSPEYTAEVGTERGAIVSKEMLFLEDDIFEAMEITDYGAVYIWSDKRVWFLHGDRGLEKLFFVYRHPNPEDYAHLNKSK